MLPQLFVESVKDASPCVVRVNLTKEPLRNEGTAHEVTTASGEVRSSIAVHSLEPVGDDQ